jgi:abortive infection bacteriophage resistance protein
MPIAIMKFSKVPFKPSQMLEQVLKRGLEGLEKNDVAFYSSVERIGYYRLTGYFLSFQESGPDPHKFRKGSTFSQVIRLYELDEKLRHLTLRAIDRIEVALRTSICELMCARFDSHWYMLPKAFQTGKHTVIFEEAAKHLDFDLEKNRFWKESGDIRKSRDAFLQHYYNKYTDPKMPAAWILRELASFGFWARTYEALNAPEAKMIAQKWQPTLGKIDHTILVNWFWSLSILRNRCAHHARIVHRKFPFAPVIPTALGGAFPGRTNDLRTLLTIVMIFLEVVQPEDEWRCQLAQLFSEYQDVDLEKAAGFALPNDAKWSDILPFKLFL